LYGSGCLRRLYYAGITTISALALTCGIGGVIAQRDPEKTRVALQSIGIDCHDDENMLPDHYLLGPECYLGNKGNKVYNSRTIDGRRAVGMLLNERYYQIKYDRDKGWTIEWGR
jgi:hypothetical protein